MHKVADPADVERFVGELKLAYLECRRYGHNWRPHTAKISRKYRGYDTSKRCPRCTLIVHEIMDRSMNIIKSWPEYPDGYLAKGIGRIEGEGRAIVRGELLMRQLDKPLRRVV